MLSQRETLTVPNQRFAQKHKVYFHAVFNLNVIFLPRSFPPICRLPWNVPFVWLNRKITENHHKGCFAFLIKKLTYEYICILLSRRLNHAYIMSAQRRSPSPPAHRAPPPWQAAVLTNARHRNVPDAPPEPLQTLWESSSPSLRVAGKLASNFCSVSRFWSWLQTLLLQLRLFDGWKKDVLTNSSSSHQVWNEA